MLRVYLDQNKWIDVMRALNGDPMGDRFRDVALMITAAVEAGDASFPLSSGHVYETWKARRAERRQPLARTMAAVSRNHAIAPRGSSSPPSSTARSVAGSDGHRLSCRCSRSAGGCGTARERTHRRCPRISAPRCSARTRGSPSRR
jgi:hypothetical protein